MNSKISIIIPVYNSERYIKDCLNSIINQSYNNFEIIIVDDGSTDNSKNVIFEFANNDARVKYFYKSNGGVSSARNFGILNATGDYVAYIDSDDMIEKDYLENLASYCNKYDFIMSGYKIWDEKANEYFKYKCEQFDGDIKEFLKELFNYIYKPLLLGPCFKLFKKSIIVNNKLLFPEDISFGEDAEFVFNYLKYATRVKCFNKSEYIYRKSNNESLSSKFIEEKIDIYNRICNDIKELYIEYNLFNNKILTNIEYLLLNNYISYCHELFSSNSKYLYKKNIFRKTYNKFDINKIIKKSKKKSIASILLQIAYNFKCFLTIYLIFKIRDSRYTRR